MERNGFVVKNAQGRFYHPGGCGYDDCWKEDFGEAKFYVELGKARSVVTNHARTNPEFPIPNIVKAKIVLMDEMPEEIERVKKVLKKK